MTRAPLHEPYADHVLTVHNVLIDSDGQLPGYEEVGDEESILVVYENKLSFGNSQQGIYFRQKDRVRMHLAVTRALPTSANCIQRRACCSLKSA